MSPTEHELARRRLEADIARVSEEIEHTDKDRKATRRKLDRLADRIGSLKNERASLVNALDALGGPTEADDDEEEQDA